MYAQKFNALLTETNIYWRQALVKSNNPNLN